MHSFYTSNRGCDKMAVLTEGEVRKRLSREDLKALKEFKVVKGEIITPSAKSYLAEHNINEPVIGLVCDGTGYGTDGKIWGCECLIASLDKFERFGHLSYYQLPGADKASKEAIRPVLSLLKKTWLAASWLAHFLVGIIDTIV